MEKNLSRKPPELLQKIAAGMLLLAGLSAAVSAPASTDPVKDYPALTYISVTQALLRLDRLKPDNDEYLDAYAMAVHCDVVAGSYHDEFRWNQAREAIKKYIATKKKTLPTRLAVRSQILLTRYDFNSGYFLFSPETPMKKVNTFNTNPRSNSPGCTNEQVSPLLPSTYQVVTNNPVNLAGIRLSQDEARDLAQKFTTQQNSSRKAYIRFLVDILDSDFIGPSMFSNHAAGDTRLKVKASLYAVEFFSDPQYLHRFYVYYPF